MKTERSFERQVVINQVSGYIAGNLFIRKIARIVEVLPRKCECRILDLPFRTGGGKIIEAIIIDFRL